MGVITWNKKCLEAANAGKLTAAPQSRQCQRMRHHEGIHKSWDYEWETGGKARLRPTTDDLTEAQKYALTQVAEATQRGDSLVFNGRVRRMIEQLEKKGYLSVEWDFRRTQYPAERIICTATDKGIRKIGIPRRCGECGNVKGKQ